MARKTVQLFVCDELHTITVSQKFTARWVAHGIYMGKYLTVEDRTEDGALKRWRATAESTASLAPSD